MPPAYNPVLNAPEPGGSFSPGPISNPAALPSLNLPICLPLLLLLGLIFLSTIAKANFHPLSPIENPTPLKQRQLFLLPKPATNDSRDRTFFNKLLATKEDFFSRSTIGLHSTNVSFLNFFMG